MLVPLEIWFVYLLMTQAGSPSLTPWVFVLLQLFLMLVVLLFYGLWIRVTDDRINLRYGIGIINFSFVLADVRSVKIVRNKWYYGLGIRLIPKGMLYNVHGLDAVELSFNNRSRIVRIGSPEVELLKYEIEKRLPNG